MTVSSAARRVGLIRAAVVAIALAAVLSSCSGAARDDGSIETLDIAEGSSSLEVLLTGSVSDGGDAALLEGVVVDVDGTWGITTADSTLIPVFPAEATAARAEFDSTGRIAGWLIADLGDTMSLGGGEARTFRSVDLPRGADGFWIVAPT